MFGKKKLTAFDADYINNLLKQVHESETIVNRTTNPTVFFGRLNFLFDCLLNLKDYEKYDIFHPEKPSDVLKNITKNLESHVNGFIDRAYTEKKKKIASLKTQTAKTNNWEKFLIQCLLHLNLRILSGLETAKKKSIIMGFSIQRETLNT